MGVRFLSDEYMAEATRIMNEDEQFLSAIEGLDLGMQFTVTDAPGEGEFEYYIRIADGRGEMARGTLNDPDARIRNSYETAAGISRGEINSATAFMTGKLKVSGNVAKLMMAQGALSRLQDAMGGIDVDY